MHAKRIYDFMGLRKMFYVCSAAITVVGIVTLIVFGLHFGVDFRAGTNLDIDVGTKTTVDEVRAVLGTVGYGDLEPRLGDNNDRVTVRFSETLTVEQVKKVEQAFVAKYGKQVSKEENTVDPQLALEQLQKAIIAVAVASLGIIVYVSIRFEWRFALAGIVALLHDAFFVITIFSIFRLEVNLPFIIAVLTIIGYSINDTIVIFDRIRENLRFAKLKSPADLAQLINSSVTQTLARSINTVATVMIVALGLFVLGSPSIRLFSLAMLIGLCAGAYSSIFIASALWYEMRKKVIKPKEPVTQGA